MTCGLTSLLLTSHRSDFKTAFALYCDLVAQYTAVEASLAISLEDFWSQVRLHLLERAMHAAHHLGSVDSKELAMLGLQYLKFQSEVSSAHDTDSSQATTQLVLQSWDRFNSSDGAGELDILGHPVFEIRSISPKAEHLEGEDGCRATVEIVSHLALPLEIDDCRLAFSGGDLEQLWFATGPTSLIRGTNFILVTCNMSVSGLFKLDSGRILLGNMTFEYQLDGEAGSSSRLLRIPRDYEALSARLQVPRHLALDGAAHLVMVLKTGRNDVEQATVAMEVADDALRWLWSEAACENLKVEPTDTSVKLPNLEKGQTYSISIPYASAARLDSLGVHISIDYITRSRQVLRRAFLSTQHLDLSLPLAVNVQDFFRPGYLLSKFTVSAAGAGSLSIGTAELSSEGTKALYTVKAATQSSRIRQLVPETPLPFVFKVSKADQHTSGLAGPRVLRFMLNYRTLPEELEMLLMAAIQQDGVLEAEPSKMLATGGEATLRVRNLSSNVLLEASRNHWTFSNPESVGDLLSSSKNDGSMLRIIKNISEQASAILPTLPWRTLSIPVEVPSMEIITCSRFIVPEGRVFMPGQPIAVRLEIRSSMDWAESAVNGEEKKHNEYEMTYDVVADRGWWLVGGRKRGAYVAKVSERLLLWLTRNGYSRQEPYTLPAFDF